MKAIAYAFLLAVLLWLGLAEIDKAFGQVACYANADAVAASLKETYGEDPVYAGVANNGHLIEVFVNDETRSWTMMLTRPDGITCALASGEGWEKIDVIKNWGPKS